MYPVWDVQWSPFGHYFATASHDRSSAYRHGHSVPHPHVRWTSLERRLRCVASERQLRREWIRRSHLATVGSVRRRSSASSPGTRGVRSIVFSPDGRTVASGADDGRVCIWDLTRATCVANLKGHVGPVYSMDYAGRRFARLWRRRRHRQGLGRHRSRLHRHRRARSRSNGRSKTDHDRGRRHQAHSARDFPHEEHARVQGEISRRNLCVAMGAPIEQVSAPTRPREIRTSLSIALVCNHTLHG